MPKVRRGNRSILFWSMLLLIVIASGAFYLSSNQVFMLMENNETQAPLLWIKVRGNSTFSLSFKHSYDKAMYVEHYKISGGRQFILTGITFRSDLNGQGFIFPNPKYLPNGWGNFQELHERMKTIPFMMGSPDQANHTLTLHGKKYFLTRFASPGEPVAFRVMSVRRFYDYVWKVEKWIK